MGIVYIILSSVCNQSIFISCGSKKIWNFENLKISSTNPSELHFTFIFPTIYRISYTNFFSCRFISSPSPHTGIRAMSQLNPGSSHQGGQNNMIGLSSQMYMQPMSSQNQNTSQGDHIQGGQTDESQSHSVFDHRKRPLNDVNNPSAKRSHLDPVTEESLAREGNLAHDPSVVGAPWPMHGDYRTQGLAPIGNGLDSGLTGEERHEYFPDYGHMRVQVPVSHPLDSHLHSLSHEGVPQHLLVAPMSMPMTMPYAMTTAPAESHSPKARVKTSKAASKATGVPEPNFIFLVPSVAGRPAHLSHAVAFGKCHFEGRCSMGCQKFKPQPRRRLPRTTIP